MDTQLVFFKGKEIRRFWNAKEEKWYFSVVDIIQILINQPDYQKSRKYWNKLKERLKKEGSQAVTNCHRLKMQAQDGKMRETDAAGVDTLLRLIQSIPNPKAESIKLWLAKVGYERIQETAGGRVAKNARLELELKTGRKIVSRENFKLPVKRLK